MALLRTLTSVTLSCSLFLAAGCALDPADDAASIPDELAEVEPMGGIIGANGLDPDCLWSVDNLVALFELGQDPLLKDGILVETDLLATACGQEVLDYTMRCALPDGETVETPAGDKVSGAYGLAPKWLEGPLSTQDKRWVSACVIQHLNGLLKHVPLMIDGDHPVFATPSGVDTSEFVVSEATMFGDFFSDLPTPNSPQQVFACAEKHFVEACGGPLGSQYLEDRICGSSNSCGLTYLGPCNAHPHLKDTKNNFWAYDDGAGTAYTETIRSYLPVDAANVQYEQCSDFSP